jgi:ATP-dependent Clp protease ATP-binding subunit ClpA
LNRPEILNRIGENVIVFDFIRAEVADEIFDQMLDALLNDVGSLGYDVSLSKTAKATLRGLCLADLSNGGRGIRNQVEAHLINPLSRALFDSGAETRRRYEIREILTGASTTVSIADEPAS